MKEPKKIIIKLKYKPQQIYRNTFVFFKEKLKSYSVTIHSSSIIGDYGWSLQTLMDYLRGIFEEDFLMDI